ncbi:putative PAS/PAC sensor protein [uncultured delta proteobacterium]|uniref:Putative PAS/PAC sensor protein n=1 Tax=uncultured delta proteobacterium TaxID=34034 RepID=A0A212KBR4_9DELT|nr:putative PAS/PAC sensor protein [uncultured delta proteobacterium]
MAQNMTPQPVDIATVGTTQKRSRLVAFGVGTLIVAVALVSFWAYKEVRSTEVKLEERLSDRAKILVDDRVAAVDTQVNGLKNAASRLLEAPMFTFFAAEVNNYKGDIGVLIAPEKRDNGAAPADKDALDKLMDNVPLMVVTLRDFCQGEGFVAGRIVNAQGNTYLSTMATTPALSDAEQRRVASVVETGKAVVSPVYTSSFGLVHDLVLPIFPPAFETQARPVSVLLLTKAVTGKNNLSELVQTTTVAGEGFAVKFIQKITDGYEKLELGSGSLSKVAAPAGITEDTLPFGVRLSVGGGEDVYSAGRRIPGTDWWIVQERSYLASRIDYHEAVQRIIILAVLASLVLALVVSVFWWRLVGKEQEEIAGQFRDLCGVIGDQKQLLDGINGTIKDPISMTDETGVYRYVNKAFGLAVSRSPEEVEGLDTKAVFGFDTAKRLRISDQKIIDGADSVTIDETIWLQSKRHFFQISKAGLKDEEGKLTGIVSVFRDITAQVEAQERGSRMVQQTIHALVRAIEASDPFLGGHSRIMGQIAVGIAKTLGLSNRDVATVEAAASLSQIGKMFVPREVLTKPGALTEDEKKIMEQHVEYAREVLKDIEFELPVLEAVYQMNERLDGEGYPQKLTGEQIGMPARVLAVANAFTAMARPRSYRAAIPVEKALSILKEDSSDYDASVVSALGKVLQTPEGERIVAQAAASQAL